MTTPTTPRLDLTSFDLVDLISRDTRLRKIANTRGGEYAGPCPKHGGRDSLHVQRAGGTDGRGIWMCRRCTDGRWGDAITYVQWRDGLDFLAAREVVGMAPPERRERTPTPEAPEDGIEPSGAWPAAAAAFLNYAEDRLWSPEDERGLHYLATRGLDAITVANARLGFNPTSLERSRAKWGLPPDPEWGDRLFLPAGIVIPFVVRGAIYKLEVRSVRSASKSTIKGSANVLFGVDRLRAGKPAMIVEGAFDALSIQQVAGDLIIPVATSSTTGARRMRWIAPLARASRVLVAYDADSGGDNAAAYWLDVLRDNARRWTPYVDDPNKMLQIGMDVRAWVQAGLEAA